VVPVAGGDVSLSSLTVGPISFGHVPDPVLDLLPAGSSARGGVTRLIAVSIPPTIHYRMEAEAGSLPFHLPTASVIGRVGLDERTIGIYATRELPEPGFHEAYIPVRVRPAGQPAGQASSTLDAVLQPEDTIEKLSWWIELPGEPSGKKRNAAHPDEFWMPGRRIDVEITPPAGSPIVAVAVQYRVVHDNQPRSRKFTIDMR
jgi:hypothetical protein